jgi:hypothetical protein
MTGHAAGMCIMLWVAVSAGGVLSSGTIEFPTQEACEAGKKSWGAVAVPLSEKVQAEQHLDARCIQKATGKP